MAPPGNGVKWPCCAGTGLANAGLAKHDEAGNGSQKAPVYIGPYFNRDDGYARQITCLSAAPPVLYA